MLQTPSDMCPSTPRDPDPTLASARLIWIFVAARLVAHAVTLAISPYGVHRDELLYLAMGDHLRLFGMDFPPFIALAANAQRALFGDGLWAIRVLPGVAGAGVIGLSMDVARRLGAGRLGMALAGLTLFASPLVLRVSTLFQPVVFDQLWWTLALWALLRTAEHPRWWIGVGVGLGLGLLTKFSIAFLAIPMAVAVAVALPRALRTRGPWAALAISLAVGLPSLAGQVALDWPFFGQMADLQATQLDRVSRASFVFEQLLLVGPAVLLAIPGFIFLVGAGRERRAVGLAAVGAFVFLLALQGKSYYAGPVWPVLVGAGAAVLAGAVQLPPWVARLRPAAIVLIIQAGWGVVALPLGLPVVPPEPMARYAARLGVVEATRTNTGVQLELPQDYADMLGWEAFVDTVGAVWSRLPEDERATATLLATNYGRAGALDLYGHRHGLPPAVAPVGSYWFWGPGDRSSDVVVVAGSDLESLQEYFTDVREVARVRDRWRVPEERDVPIHVGRGARIPLAELWPSFAGQN